MLNVIQLIFKHAMTLAPAIVVILIMLVLAELTAHIDQVETVANVDIDRLDHIAVSGLACQAALFSDLTQQLTHEYSTVYAETCGW